MHLSVVIEKTTYDDTTAIIAADPVLGGVYSEGGAAWEGKTVFC